MTPFSVAVEKAPSSLQLELVRLQHNSILKDRYYHFNGDLVSSYRGIEQLEFPRIRALALKFTAMFGTTYVCEQLFSLMNFTKCKTRSCLSDAALQSLLRIQSARTLTPNLAKLVKEKNVQPLENKV